MASGAVQEVQKEQTEGSRENYWEYEAQFFGFTPQSFLNGIYNSVCDIYREALKAFCDTISREFPSVMSEEELREAKTGVGKKIDEEVNSVFDSMEAYLLETVFKIPEGVVFPEDSCQLQLPPSENDRNAQSLHMEQRKMELKKKIIAVKYANAVLSQHLEESKVFKKKLDTIVQAAKTSGLKATQIRDQLSYLTETLLTDWKHHHNPLSEVDRQNNQTQAKMDTKQ